jgi:hypothetical protein
MQASIDMLQIDNQYIYTLSITLGFSHMKIFLHEPPLSLQNRENVYVFSQVHRQYTVHRKSYPGEDIHEVISVFYFSMASSTCNNDNAETLSLCISRVSLELQNVNAFATKIKWVDPILRVHLHVKDLR